MNNFFNAFADKLDVYIIGIVLLSGYFQKIYLKGIKFTSDNSYNEALKTLLLSAIVSAIYIFLLKDPNKPDNWSKYFISYFTATSLYELLVDKFVSWIQIKVSPKS